MLTGGGAMLKHVDQLTEFTTGMATRIGYPNEHLAKDVANEMASPMFATGVGLVIEGISRFNEEKSREAKIEENDDNSKANFLNRSSKSKLKKAKDENGESGTTRFLKGLREWFENDTTE